MRLNFSRGFVALRQTSGMHVRRHGMPGIDYRRIDGCFSLSVISHDGACHIIIIAIVINK